MKINSISLISLVSALTIATSANAGAIADFYVGGMLGAGGHTLFADHNNKSDSSLVLGAIAGVDIPLFRIEGEYNYLTSSDIHANTAMVNAYFKMPSTLIMPYIGAGFGVLFSGEHEIDNKTIDMDTVAAYQGMMGVTVDVPLLPVKFDVEGRVLYAANVYEVESVKPDLLEYNVRLKARFIF
jgi:hypothetical protein